MQVINNEQFLNITVLLALFGATAATIVFVNDLVPFSIIYALL